MRQDRNPSPKWDNFFFLFNIISFTAGYHPKYGPYAEPPPDRFTLSFRAVSLLGGVQVIH